MRVDIQPVILPASQRAIQSPTKADRQPASNKARHGFPTKPREQHKPTKLPITDTRACQKNYSPHRPLQGKTTNQEQIRPLKNPAPEMEMVCRKRSPINQDPKGCKQDSKIPFHVFNKICLVPYSSFQDFIGRIIGICRCPSFR